MVDSRCFTLIKYRPGSPYAYRIQHLMNCGCNRCRMTHKWHQHERKINVYVGSLNVVSLTLPWLFSFSLTFQWLVCNSLTFPGFPAEWSSCFLQARSDFHATYYSTHNCCTVYLSYYYRVGQKSRPLPLTVRIFKTSEPICVIFGTFQHCFVLNTFVNSILNKFITAVAPPSDKTNNSVFHLLYQARSLHSNSHVFKISTLIMHNFWHNWTSWYFRYARYFIFINCLIQRHAIWRKKNSLFSYYKQLKSDFVEPFLLPGSVQMLHTVQPVQTAVTDQNHIHHHTWTPLCQRLCHGSTNTAGSSDATWPFHCSLSPFRSVYQLEEDWSFIPAESW